MQATVAAGPSIEPPPAKRKRAARTRRIISQAPGMEASAQGEERVEVEQPKQAGMFTASSYFWLYYSAKPGLKKVAVGKLAEAGECHAHLDDAADADADSIAGSNSTYEFAGVCADTPELLYTRTYSCACRSCREPTAVSVEHKGCPHMSTVGKFQQQTIHSSTGVSTQRKVQLVKTATFAAGIKADALYAAFASYRERGNRDYWLLLTKSEAKQAKKAIKVAGGTTIRKDTWIVEAQWYLSTSDDQGRKSYSLLDGTVHVPVASLVQEHGLAWAHQGRGANGQSILSKEAHAALMSHNYSNVA